MTEDIETTSKEPVAEERRRWSPVWLIPLIALVLAGWLGWQAWQERGVKITVIFQNGTGIEAGKTPVRYNGLQIGKVESVSMQPDLKGVQARVDMNREVEGWLTDKTQFWLVKPEVSLAGVSGIETLFSGNYITFRPSHGNPSHRFQALADAPPLAMGKPGLHVSLISDDAGSLIAGSPVYYRHIQVGEVERVVLKDSGRCAQIDTYIEPEYASLVRNNTHFWNVSGISISGPLPNIKVKTDSLLSIVKGGVAFSTPAWEAQQSQAGQHAQFTLYSDFESARAGIPITIEFPLNAYIVQAGARVMFHGIEAGVVRDYEIKHDESSFSVNVSMNPLAAPALVKGARFWLVEPKLTLHGIEGLDALFSGRYIAMDVADKAITAGHAERTFHGYTNKPPAGPDAPGLHITLLTDNAGGLEAGSAVWMRGVNIGSVQDVSLHRSGVKAAVLIDPAFQSLMRSGVKFWQASGVSASLGLSGLTVASRPLAAMVSGGIFCEAPLPDAKPLSNGVTLPLYPDRESAYRSGREVTLFSPTLSSVTQGAPVFYKGVTVGRVQSANLANPADRVKIQVFINSPYELLVTDASRFWNVSGLDVEVSALKGIEIHSQSVEALVRGGIAFATPDVDEPASSDASFLLHAKAEPQWLRWNPPIRLQQDSHLRQNIQGIEEIADK